MEMEKKIRNRKSLGRFSLAHVFLFQRFIFWSGVLREEYRQCLILPRGNSLQFWEIKGLTSFLIKSAHTGHGCPTALQMDSILSKGDIWWNLHVQVFLLSRTDATCLWVLKSFRLATLAALLIHILCFLYADFITTSEVHKLVIK